MKFLVLSACLVAVTVANPLGDAKYYNELREKCGDSEECTSAQLHLQSIAKQFTEFIRGSMPTSYNLFTDPHMNPEINHEMPPTTECKAITFVIDYHQEGWEVLAPRFMRLGYCSGPASATGSPCVPTGQSKYKIISFFEEKPVIQEWKVIEECGYKD